MDLPINPGVVPCACSKSIVLDAPAKINLTFQITGKLPDGYHTVRSVMHPITLMDRIILGILPMGQDILRCNRPGIPLDGRNICTKAVDAFFHHTGLARPAFFLDIQKQIPDKAGLGGGSADAAAVLIGLNRLYQTGLTRQTLGEIGATFGADVPFCVGGRPALATGFGEQLAGLPALPPCFLVVVKPPVGSDTGLAFAKADSVISTAPLAEKMMAALESGQIQSVAQNLHNDFEAVLHLPQVEANNQLLREKGAIGALMCGSGTASFGLFTGAAKAQAAAAFFQSEGQEAFFCQPLSPPQK